MSEELNEIEVSEIDTEEQARIEHENMLKSFPDTTVFYQEIREEEGYKWLAGTVTNPETADKYGILDNNINMSELIQKNGRLYLKDYVAPDPELAELKARKLAEIKAVADQYAKYECETMYLTSSVGYRINADHKSQDNIRGLIALGQPCAFKDFDNVFHTNTSIEDLNTMLNECYANGASLYQQKFEYEARVDAAKSAEDLYFEVIFSMADFSA